MARAAVSGESPTQFFEETADDVRDYARRMLGIIEGEGIYGPDADAPGDPDLGEDGPLRARGAELLRQSADVRFEENAHPAYERMLEEIAPDEGRVLRLLALEGPQPAVDVRSGGIFGIGSELVEAGLSIIGAEAGCRYPDRVRSYLNNLFRLGLVWFSREPVDDPVRYQVLEAQPDATKAMGKAKRPSTVRRSIELTPFGHDFCKQCLPLEEEQTAADGDSED
jgi:abortive infection alpha-like protein